MTNNSRASTIYRRRSAWPAALLTPLLLTACVTINVYFPAAAAEQAADRIVREVYGQQPPPQEKPAEEKPEAPKASDPDKRSGINGTRIFARVLDVLIAPAQAAADLNVSTPAIKSITESMAERQGALRPYYESGAVGMTNSGLITLRDQSIVPLKERNRARQLVADENRDREALYREIARANGHPEWEDEIRQTFAQRWIANAPKGWHYQDAKGNWKQK